MKYLKTTLIGLLIIAGSLVVATPALAEMNILQPKSESPAADGDNEGVQDLVEDTFGSDHVMTDVARCESSFRQYGSDGDVLTNEESGAVGVFQLLEDWHAQPAEDIGLSIYTAEGNIEYAEELYELDGLKPWSPSSLCWDDGTVIETDTDELRAEASSRTPVVVRSRDDESDDSEGDDAQETSKATDQSESAEEDNGSAVITKKLIIGVDDPQVRKLQELLNETGYEPADDGPGSAGEETSFFGSLTKQALQEFQCDQGIVCEGTEYTTGFGVTNAKTRAALNEQTDEVESSNRVRMQIRSADASVDANTGTEEATASSDESLAAQIQQAQTLINQLQQRLSQ